MQHLPQFLTPDWPAPLHIKAFTSLRVSGFSKEPYDSFNLGIHVGDDPLLVQRNRTLLMNTLNLSAEPLWMQQVHGIEVVEYMEGLSLPVIADASIAFSPNQICVVLTADCLPVLICDKFGRKVAAIHAGWRGLAAGVIEAAVKKLNSDPNELLVWLGPAIGPEMFEVGEEVLEAFDIVVSQIAWDNFAECVRIGFRPIAANRFLANIYHLARQRLNKIGIQAIFGGTYCTVTEKDRFYSYRRDKKTGRMASLIWIDNQY